MTTTRPAKDVALVWFRRDLRLTDQPALAAALDRHAHVVPVYIADFASEGAWAPGGAQRWWLHHSLTVLDEALRQAGARLIVRHGDSLAELRRLIRETGAGAVYWNRLYEPEAIARDRRIKAALREDGLAVDSFNASLWAEPGRLKTGGGDPYKVFTPFWRTLQQQLPELRLQPAPTRIAMPHPHPHSLELAALELLPRLDWADAFPQHWRPGEAGALQALAGFVDAPLSGYGQRRDLPAVGGTSRLSPHLHFGEISPQQARAALRRSGANEADGDAAHFLRELGWREFAHHLLFAFPDTTTQPLYEKFGKLPWRDKHDYARELQAWQRGATGIPIVDAGMRELWATGWMHNRVRMIAASFLIKHLLIDWRHGAQWFWDTLVDANYANNSVNWQWVAGSGVDANLFTRIMAPLTQSPKFDAADYIRRWVPELAQLDDKTIHDPDAYDARPPSYPSKRIGHREARERALAAYRRTRTGR